MNSDSLGTTLNTNISAEETYQVTMSKQLVRERGERGEGGGEREGEREREGEGEREHNTNMNSTLRLRHSHSPSAYTTYIHSLPAYSR